MKIHISEPLGRAIGFKFFAEFGLSESEWSWRGGQKFDITKCSDTQLKKLEAMFAKHEDIRSARTLVRDLQLFNRAKTDAGGSKARTCEQFALFLKEYLVTFPGPRVYKRNDDELWLAYYVNEIEYHSPTRYSSAYVHMELVHEDIAGRHETKVNFYGSDVVKTRVSDVLLNKGYYVETDELRAIYLAEHERHMSILPRIGKQYLASGTGTDDLDGNKNGYSEERRWWRDTQSINFVRDGEPARVVIDVYAEGTEKLAKADLNFNFWNRKRKNDDDDDEEDENPRIIEIPVHPYVPVFDLRRHMRLRTHADNLTEYTYDTEISEKLILPTELKTLVQMLVEHKDAGFKDIVRGKSGGAVVLLAGPPGVGKTLTAEVFAENEKRALYSVQCSQLGTTADELENELLKVFARAKRWNAVLLLDEADVYVHTRGMDMQQNAIVGVFLRVLEYQSTVMFMTTNRPDDVDDAVLSRCLARLVYDYPDDDQQWRIWKVLAAGVGIIVDESIKRDIVREHRLSGRDVKNLIKLSILMSKGNPKVTSEHVQTAMQFHPTIRKA